MNYTKLKLNDQEIGLKFGMYSARYLSDKLTNGYCFNGDEITEIGIAHVIYGGYLNNCAIKDIQADITFEDIVDHVESSITDASKVDALTSVIKVWSESQLIKAATEDTKKNKSSKKLKS
jgi:hypothetical protein